MDNRPIGIFDSGMGGLTVRAGIVRALPRESLVYFGDGANTPYGPRPKEEIIEFVDEAVARLVDNNDVKMMVIACNAATGAAITHLRAKYDIPIIGMEPAVKPAALTTKSGTIGVLATAAAFRGELYRSTSAQYADVVEILETVGEGFVELVENDLEATPEAYETVRRAVGPMLEAGADRIVLGCTHYPFLAEQIRRVIDEFCAKTSSEADSGSEKDSKAVSAGVGAPSSSPSVQIVDSGPAIARRVEQLLTDGDMHADSRNTPRHRFLSFADDYYVEHLTRKSANIPRIG